jgi:hypothetical protein
MHLFNSKNPLIFHTIGSSVIQALQAIFEHFAKYLRVGSGEEKLEKNDNPYLTNVYAQ